MLSYTATVLRVLGVLLLLTGMVLSLFYFPFADYIEQIRNQGAWGPVLLIPTYIVACLLFVPGSIVNMTGGFLFGVTMGTVSTMIGGVLGATAAFLVGRTLARGWVQSWMAGRRRFRAINRAVDREGFKIVVLLRLSPIYPFNLLNYAFGLTKVSLGDYFLGTMLGIIPSTVMYVCLGSAAKNVAQLLSGRADVGQQVLLGIGLVATVGVTIMVMRIGRRALQEELPAAEDASKRAESGE